MGNAPDMSEYLGVFLDEADEQVDTLDEGLLRLEECPDDMDLLQGIFRAAHSLKSSSAAMGFASMSRLCHASENLLDKFRIGAMTPNSARIDYLLRAVDAIKGMKDAIRGGGSDDADTSEVVAALLAAGSGEDPAASAAAREDNPVPSATPAPAASGPGIGLAPPPTFEALEVTIRLAGDCMMPAVRAHMSLRALEQVGRILRTMPSREELAAGAFGLEFRVIASAEGGEPALRGALESVSEVENVQIGPDPRAVDVGPAGRGRPATEVAAMAKQGDQTVRVAVSRLDNLMNLVGELVIDRTRITQLGLDLEAHFGGSEIVQNLRETARHMARIVGDLQEDVMKARMLPIAQLFRRFPRMVRDLAHGLSKDIELVLEGEDTELDRSVIEEMVDPLTHVLRNAVDHGVEVTAERARLGKPLKSKVILAARQEENHILIEVIDDGAGIDVQKLRQNAIERGLVSEAAASAMPEEEALQLIFVSGLSTAKAVSDVSGRGVGMDVVKTNVAHLHGTVRVQTKLGVGTTMTIRLPLTLAISQSLLVTSGAATIAIPLVYVEEAARVAGGTINTVEGRPMMTFRGRVLPVVGLQQALGRHEDVLLKRNELVRVVVVRSGEREVGLVVDNLVGEQEVVLKPLGSALGEVVGLSGATILGDGTVALVLDVASIVDASSMQAAAAATRLAAG